MDLREEFNKIKKESLKNRPATDRNENYDNILLRLHRQYSKDEVVAASQKRLSEVQIELGKWKAYTEELEENISKIKISKANFENIITDVTNKKVIEFRQEFNEIKRENLELREYVKNLLEKLAD